MMPDTPIPVKHLFKPLDDLLINLLESLSPEEWNKHTVAKAWTVKDVASHLLDGNIRTLSIQRDNFFGEKSPVSNSYMDMVGWLNGLNADWIKASKRISPDVLILLHKATRDLVTTYYQSLDLNAPAIFPVDWAGETESLNWMHLAREYTEKWHHQQQIREATGRDGIMTREFFYPFIDSFFRALPHTFRKVGAPLGTIIKINVTTQLGGNWYLQKQASNWQLQKDEPTGVPAATVSISPQTSWKLFSKSIRPEGVRGSVELTGDTRLAEHVLQMVSVMA
ncbi:maleylpyruvate isomerase N-terminal domain-containing protein [Mucilaginibacter pineti]|nr:maleylpyruvate isomerase N-terminal domain-containing protein [Mucilaginibacter pineti]